LSHVITGSPGGGPALAVAVRRLISSHAIPVGGLTPGTLLTDRYRIIGLLGRGGMGEVYRADDLKLGQAVALKFLPRSLSSDPVRRERFFAEVRITRQLAHPNICRVYDIAEVDGQHFLSMEYIDGEDLASLLTRIGHLSNEKALDITRQLLAGLAAAHERGVLHRDLKPANIMIDGRGRVRITDFGLAVAESEGAPAGDMSGTPAYMAPEQLAGKGSSVRSDIYALGLVLYEILSGKRAFAATTLAELRTEKEQATPRAPSEIRTGIEPAVERLVMRRLERDPRARPSSVAQLAAALPGGDPLAAALAAGETPSPELVAASGAREGLRPAHAIGLLIFVALGALTVIAMNERVMLYGRVSLGKSPDVLVERAQQFLTRVGYTTPRVDSAYGFVYITDFVNYMQAPERRPYTADELKAFGPLVFWYRQSPFPIYRTAFFRSIASPSNDPPIDAPGEAVVRFDGDGHLRNFEIVPPATDLTPPPTITTDLSFLLMEAGFDVSDWKPVAPARTPHFYADTRAAWEGTLLNEPHRIEAGAYRGKPVYFAIDAPRSRARLSVPPQTPTRLTIALALFLLFLLVLVAGGSFFARRNLRLGRGDRRGATRLVLCVIVLFAGSWMFSEHHVATPWEVVLFFMAAGQALTFAGLLWLIYIALEPFVRRRWPHMLVSWTRLLSGAFGDQCGEQRARIRRYLGRR
jgi:serine/threonine-protein kinase